MIKECKDTNTFLDIVDKLKEVKECRLKANTLYVYMVSGIYNKNTFTYTSYDSGKMNGCLVLKRFTDNSEIPSFMMLFVWVNAHYTKLLEEFIKFTDKKAKELGIKKIYFAANYKEKVIIRRVGRFGFGRAYITYCKEVK